MVEVTVVNTHATICVRTVFIQPFPPIGVTSDFTEIVSLTIGYKLESTASRSVRVGSP